MLTHRVPCHPHVYDTRYIRHHSKCVQLFGLVERAASSPGPRNIARQLMKKLRVSLRQCNTGDTVVLHMSKLSGAGPGFKNKNNLE